MLSRSNRRPLATAFESFWSWSAIAWFVGRAGSVLDRVKPLCRSREVRVGLEIVARGEAFRSADSLSDQLAEFRNVEIRGVHKLFSR